MDALVSGWRGLRRALRWTWQQLSRPSRVVVGLAVTLSLVVLMLDLRGRAGFARASFPDAADSYYLPPPKATVIMSLGYREAAADLVWIAAIQHAGDRRARSGVHAVRWLEKYLETIFELNPRMKNVYLWGDGLLTYGHGRLSNYRFLRSIAFLQRGQKLFPKDWRFLFKLAVNHSELRSKSPEQRSRWMRIAADYLWKAHLVGGGPPWLASLAGRYWSEEGQWELAYHRIREAFARAEDPRLKRALQDRLATILARGAGGMLQVERFARLATPTVGNLGALASYLLGQQLAAQRVRRAAFRRVDRFAAQKARFDAMHRGCLPYASSDLFAVLGRCPDFAQDTEDGTPQ